MKTKQVNIPEKLYNFIESMAKALNEPLDEFLIEYLSSALETFNQTPQEHLEAPDSREPGQCVYLTFDPFSDPGNGCAKTVVEQNVTYSDACHKAYMGRTGCFKWSPYSLIKEEEESGVTCGTK